ncbi:MAG: helix-turn-helix domain-containing protein [Candidatus Binatia bacterium]
MQGGSAKPGDRGNDREHLALALLRLHSKCMISGVQCRMGRAALNWTIERLARAAGVNKTTVTFIECGKVTPKPATIEALRGVMESAGVQFIDGGARLIELQAASPPTSTTTGPVRSNKRQLSIKILAAFHVACDDLDLELAERLLRILENVLTQHLKRVHDKDKRSQENLVTAYQRLWELRRSRSLDLDEGFAVFPEKIRNRT